MLIDYTSFDSNIVGGVVAQKFSVAFGTFPLPVIWEPSASLINPIQAGGGVIQPPLDEFLTWCNEIMMMRALYSLTFPNFVSNTFYNWFYVFLSNGLIFRAVQSQSLGYFT